MATISQDIYNKARNISKLLFQTEKTVGDYELNELQDMVSGFLRDVRDLSGGIGAVGDGFLVESSGSANELTIRKGVYLTPKGRILFLEEDYTLSSLTTLGGARTDYVYLEIASEEKTEVDFADIVNPEDGKVLALRLVESFSIEISEGSKPSAPADASSEQVELAILSRAVASPIVIASEIEDRRGVYGQTHVLGEGGGYLRVTDAGGLAVSVEAGGCLVAGVRYTLAASSPPVTPASTSYVYVDDDGVLTVSTTRPYGPVLNLATVVSGAGSITSITDTRRFAPAGALSETVAALKVSSGASQFELTIEPGLTTFALTGANFEDGTSYAGATGIGGLSAGSTNYIYWNIETASVLKSTSSFPTQDAIPLWTVDVDLSGFITNPVDRRPWFGYRTNAAGAGSSNALKSIDIKDTPDAFDDEFDETTLDGDWTVVAGSAGTVVWNGNGGGAGGDGIYDLTSRDSWLLIQGDQNEDVLLRKDYTLASGECVVAKVSAAACRVSSDDHVQFGIAINNDDSDPSAGASALFYLNDVDGLAWDVQVTGAGAYGGINHEYNYNGAQALSCYLRIDRTGTGYVWYFSKDGSTWVNMFTLNTATIADNIWIFSTPNGALPTEVPVHGVDWVRLGVSDAIDPWEPGAYGGTASGVSTLPNLMEGKTFFPLSGGSAKILEEVVPALAPGQYSAHVVDFSDVASSLVSSTPRVDPITPPSSATHAVIRVALDSVRDSVDTTVAMYVGAFDDGMNLTTPANANGTNDPNEFIAAWATTSESNQIHESSAYSFASGVFDYAGNIHYETRYVELNDPALGGGDLLVAVYSTSGNGAGSVTAFLDGWLIDDAGLLQTTELEGKTFIPQTDAQVAASFHGFVETTGVGVGYKFGGGSVDLTAVATVPASATHILLNFAPDLAFAASSGGADIEYYFSTADVDTVPGNRVAANRYYKAQVSSTRVATFPTTIVLPINQGSNSFYWAGVTGATHTLSGGTAPLQTGWYLMGFYIDDTASFGGGTFTPEATLTDGDTTPSVSGLFRAVTANSGATSVTTLDDMVDNQTVELRVNDSNTTFVHSASLVLQHGHDVKAQAGDVWLFKQIDGVVTHLAGGNGMAAPGTVMLDDPVSLASWISSATVAYTAVGTTSYGVPLGATAAIVKFWFDTPSADYILKIRHPDSVTDDSSVSLPISSALAIVEATRTVGLNAAGEFDAKFQAAATFVSDDAWIVGYVKY